MLSLDAAWCTRLHVYLLDYGRHRGRSAAFTTAVRAAVVVLRITMVSFDYM